ncbi:MAG TPA: ABC transporter ATP-binding protein [Myxococcales bacterium]|nr:ABC transporter ATP-binding protein [Myxococcales bacterium]
MPPTVAVHAQNLSKTFRIGFWGRKVRAAQDVSFDVEKGEIFGLLGPNGAGKTTTIKMLLGFVRPSRGSATVGGHPAGSIEARRRMGYLPENPALYEYLTGVEYLRYAGRLAGLGRKEAQQRGTHLLEQVGLADRADRPIRRFSKGMVQRLGLAQAMIGDPELLILDEPMSGLDPIGRKDVRDLILRFREEGRTIMFSTHILSDVEMICDRVAILIDGRVTDCGTLGSLLDPAARVVEVAARDVPAAVDSKLRSQSAQSVQRDGSSVYSFASEDAANEAVRAIALGGGRIVAVQPHRYSLEELFVKRAAGAKGSEAT